MSNKQNVFLFFRLTTLIFWLTVLMTLFGYIGDDYGVWLIYCGMAIFVAHIIELVVFKKFIQQADNKAWVIVNILLFGLFWILPNNTK